MFTQAQRFSGITQRYKTRVPLGEAVECIGYAAVMFRIGELVMSIG